MINSFQTPAIPTLIAEASAVTREGLAAILGREPDIELVAAARNGDDAVSAVRALRPQVALLSAAFGGDEGIGTWITVAERARAAAPDCQLAIIGPGWQCHEIRNAAAAGVRGFLVPDAPAEDLIGAVRRLASGLQVLDPRLSRTLSSPLTAREADVLRVAESGATTAEIARVLCLTEGTVRNYLSRAIAKTGARNRLGAARTAAESGWL